MASLDLATLMVRIEADISKALEGMEQVGEQSQKQADKTKTNWEAAGKALTDIGGTLTKAITVPLTAAATACVKLASDLTETLGKTEVVFGELSDSVIAWSETAVENMGLAQQTALDMASTYGDLGTSMGLTTNEAANMSMELVQLAADMASFKNISVERANTALQAVYTGETESLKAMGIVMTEANLNAFAMNEGLETTYSNMSQTEKVMLRYKYVMAQTTNAQGDFVRTGDSLANQSRKLVQNLKELGASFGKILEPAVTSIVSTLNNVVSWFRNLDDSWKRVIITIGEVAAVIPVVVLAIGTIITAVHSLNGAITTLLANPVVLAITTATAVIAALGIVMYNLCDAAEASTEGYEAFKKSLDESVKAKIDTSDIDDLDGKQVNITLDADTEKAIETAKGLISDLSEYSGEITIDGDPQKAQTALSNLQQAIEKAEAFMKIGGTAEEAEQVRVDLKAAIDGTKGIVAIGANADTVNALLDSLRKQSITIYAHFEPEQTYEETVDGLIAKTNELKGDKTAIGKFVIEEGTQDSIEEYIQGLADATTAVTEFDEQVSNLDAIIDRMQAEKEAAIVTQMLAQSQALYASYMSGNINYEQYNQGMAEIAQSANEARASIQSETEALKESNAVFADGKVDTVNWGTTYATAMGMSTDATNSYTVSTDQAAASIQALSSGTGSYYDATIAWTAIQQENINNTLAAAEAEKQYNAEMAQAKTDLEQTVAYQTESAEQAGKMARAYDNIYGAMAMGETASAAFNQTLEAYPALITELVDTTGSSVEILDEQTRNSIAAASGNAELQSASDYLTTSLANCNDPAQALEETMLAYPSVSSQVLESFSSITAGADVNMDRMGELWQYAKEAQTEALNALDQAETDYQSKTEAAQSTYTENMSAITSTYTAEEVAAIAKMCNDNGMELSEADVEAQTTTTAMMEGITEAVADGSPDAVEEVHTCVNGMITEADKLENGGSDSGKNLITGMISGIEDKEGSLYSKVRWVVSKAIEAARQESDSHSPSRKTKKLIGIPFAQGIETGIEEYMPTLLKSTKKNIGSIITAGTGVINSDYRTKPNAVTNIGKQGNTTINQTNNFTSRTLSPYEQQQQVKKMNKQLAEVFA